MRKSLILFTIMVIGMMGGVRINAQTDYTNRITNPSFEDGTMNGWTVYRGGEVDAGAAGSKLVANFPLTNSDGSYICDYYGWAVEAYISKSVLPSSSILTENSTPALSAVITFSS